MNFDERLIIVMSDLMEIEDWINITEFKDSKEWSNVASAMTTLNDTLTKTNRVLAQKGKRLLERSLNNAINNNSKVANT